MCYSILCPGPSLEDLKELKSEGPVLAVNRAVKRKDLPIDYWFHMDGLSTPQLRECRRDDLPPSITLGKWDENLNVADTLTDEKVAALGDPGVSWLQCSMLGAIAWCALDGAKHIKLYGATFYGKTYYDCTGNIKEARWEREKGFLEKAIVHLAKRGIKLERMS
jgi:hypothetical protein